MKTIEEITALIIAESQTRHELQCSGSNHHTLILTADGDVYWSEEIDQHSCSEAVWKGEDTRLISFQGWTPDQSFAYYDMIEATAEEMAEIQETLEEFRDENEIKVGETAFYRGDKDFGFDAAKWYSEGDLLSYSDCNPDTSPEEHMADAVEAAEIFLSQMCG